MTPSLPLILAAPLVAGLMGSSLTGTAPRVPDQPVHADSSRSADSAVGDAPVDAANPATDGTDPEDLGGDREQDDPGKAPERARTSARVTPGADVVTHTAAAAPAGYWTAARRARALPISLLPLVDQIGTTVGDTVGSTVGNTVGSTVANTVADLTDGALPEPSPPLAGHSRHTGPSAGHRGTSGQPRATAQRTGTSQRTGTAQRTGAPWRARSTTARTDEARRRATPPSVTSGSRWAAGGMVRRTTGRVFLTMSGLDFVCSGSAVRSANRDVVVTAAHCVKDGAGAWAENWTFVPGYDEGREPYGTYAARQFFVAGPWSRGGDDNYDVGMVAVAARDGRHLTDVVGGQTIAFNSARGLPIHSFGFPADPPYNGEHLLYCAGPVHGDPYKQTRDQGVRCDLTAGASGGPWLTWFDRTTGVGTVTSVSSFKYSNDRGTMYGPYFGDAVQRLFQTAERS